ncbi:MAG: dehydrogenase [Planctomycetaceae bacterium]|jgi:uncharacterized oxidoreductase|nr:dehydrogenase [Planctomycetaceae bacterium]MDP7274493.1 Ldh family oxidoreductase [Planctomycetaceae bacterium]
MTIEPLQIPADQLIRFGSSIFQAAGVPVEEADIVATSLVGSNLRGHDSHGVVRIPRYLPQLEKGELLAGVELKVTSETAALLCADAGFGFGMVQMTRLIDRLVEKVDALGVACGTLSRCGHVGRLGEWAEAVAMTGRAGLVTVNDNGVLKCVAPPGGVEPTVSTNPIAIGVPTDGDPLVLDISTSVVANGKILVRHTSGESCPEGWLLDAEGRPTTDPAVRFSDPRGTILPAGGYKGFGLAMLLDILVGGLSGGNCPPAPSGAPGTNNVLLIIWDPERFSGQEHFEAEADRLIAFVRGVKRRDDVESIRLAGDRSAATMAERLEQGVPLDAGTWSSLCEAADSLGIKPPESATGGNARSSGV